MKRILFFLMLLLLGLLLTAAAGWLWSLRTATAAFPAELTGWSGAVTGEGLVCSFEQELPLARMPREATLVLPPELAGEADFHFRGYRWNRARWRFTVRLTPLRSGETGEGKLLVRLPVDRLASPETVEIRIAPFEVAPGEEAGGEPELAGELAPPRRAPVLLFAVAGAALLLLAAVVAGLARRRRRPEPPEPPWRTAIARLLELRVLVGNRQIGLEAAFVRLTDVVRVYLEARYALPASTRTTDEFLRELESPASPLPPAERPFLKDFLAAADLVKFARQPPEESGLLRAVDGAERLVRETGMKPEEATHV